MLTINVHQRSVEGPNFTSFVVVMKNESFRSVQKFAVPDNVNLEKVLQILRDKGVKVVEPPLPS
jgi:predicted RNA-binding protein